MGALDKRIFSGVAFVAALLAIVSAALLYSSGADPSADGNSTALYTLLVAGILAIVYSISMFLDGSSFVRKVSGILVLVSGIMFIATPVAGESAATVLAAAGLVAGLAMVADMLALWVSRIYGAMYVSAVLAAIGIVTGAMCLINGYSDIYALTMLLAFAVWFVIGAWVYGFVREETVTKTREVVEDTVAQKKEKPQAKNRKATPKAKKAEPAKPAEEEPKAEEPKKVRTVELPKTAAAQAAIHKSQESAKTEAPKEEPKQEQKPPAKAMGDFMQKLMSSEAASKAVRKEVHEEKPAAQPEAPKEEPRQEAAPEIPEAPIEEPKTEETPAEEVVEEKPVVDVAPEMPEESVIETPVEPAEKNDLFKTEEPNWGVVARDSVAEEPVMRLKSSQESEPEPAPEAPAEQPVVEEPKTEEAPETVPETEGAPAEEPAPEVPSEPVPSDDTPAVDVAPEVTESVISAPVETPAEPAEEPAAEPNWDVVARDTSEPEPAPEAPAAEEPVEDIYTDNSPEALVRRAAWNKGLRCRRGYGERNIPVAFVKGKVAVYVDDGEPDTSGDDELRAEGWTVLRYRAEDITDGKAQGDEIAAAVRENTKSTAKKKKAKK